MKTLGILCWVIVCIISCILMTLTAFTDLINIFTFIQVTIVNITLTLIGGILYKMD